MSTKNYDTDREGLEDIERSFTLCGIEFHCLPIMPGAAFDDLASIELGQSGVRLYATACDVIRQTLKPESQEAWDELLERGDPDVPFSFSLMYQICEDLLTEETGRPPRRSSRSGNTGAKSSTSSTENSGSPEAQDSRPFRSVPA